MTDESNSLVVLTRVPTEAEASLIVQCLTSQNIAAQAVGGFTSGFRAEAPGDVSVLVRNEDLERALTALTMARQDHSSEQSTLHDEGDLACRAESRLNTDVTFECHDCGTHVTFPDERCGHVEICPNCGSYVDVPEDAGGSRLAESTAVSPLTPRSVDVEHPKTPGSDSRTAAQLWIEVVAILCLSYIPWMFGVLSAINGRSSNDFVRSELSHIVTAFQISLPLLLIVSLTGEPWSLFGIVRPKWFADIGGGCALCLASLVAHHFIMGLLPHTMLKTTPAPRIVHSGVGLDGIATFLLVLATYVASGFVQELVMRAYLIARLERLLRSTGLAVVVTSVLFGSYHLYQGFAPAIGAAGVGLVYAIWFCLFRRLWPLCVAHAVGNLMIYLGNGQL